ncbi:MAG: serine/threonine protein phosphatase [Alphaproteobacteria bacterium]|nr:serine/threonine protein phosphatase [Alphaproteobacteria bacterium]
MLGWLKPSRESKPPADTRVYAIGDIHGQIGRLKTLHDRILEDARGAPEARRVIVYVGDYVDRGPDARGVLDMLIAQPLEGFVSVYLKGNHEDFMLRFLDGDIEAGASWFANGGDATLASYGIDVEGDYAFVHAGIRPGVPLEAQSPRDLMWIREEFHASRAEHDYVIVHGHSVSTKAVDKANRIGIDTGAGYGRALTAVVLSGAERRFLQG